MIQIKALPFGSMNNLNYWVECTETGALGVVDLADGVLMIKALTEARKTPSHIFITHHHHDHVEGLGEFLDHFPKAQLIYPEGETRIGFKGYPYKDRETIRFGATKVLGLLTQAHTRYSLNYLFDSRHLFTGDSLFFAGCGRLFEGSPADLLTAMDRLCALSPDIKTYYGHDYAQSNLEFSAQIEPNNSEITKQKNIIKSKGAPLFSSIALERLINPFFRIDQKEVIQAIDPQGQLSREERIGHLRQKKDQF